MHRILIFSRAFLILVIFSRKTFTSPVKKQSTNLEDLIFDEVFRLDEKKGVDHISEILSKGTAGILKSGITLKNPHEEEESSPGAAGDLFGFNLPDLFLPDGDIAALTLIQDQELPSTFSLPLISQNSQSEESKESLLGVSRPLTLQEASEAATFYQLKSLLNNVSEPPKKPLNMADVLKPINHPKYPQHSEDFYSGLDDHNVETSSKKSNTGESITHENSYSNKNTTNEFMQTSEGASEDNAFNQGVANIQPPVSLGPEAYKFPLFTDVSSSQSKPLNTTFTATNDNANVLDHFKKFFPNFPYKWNPKGALSQSNSKNSSLNSSTVYPTISEKSKHNETSLRSEFMDMINDHLQFIKNGFSPQIKQLTEESPAENNEPVIDIRNHKDVSSFEHLANFETLPDAVPLPVPSLKNILSNVFTGVSNDTMAVKPNPEAVTMDLDTYIGKVSQSYLASESEGLTSANPQSTSSLNLDIYLPFENISIPAVNIMQNSNEKNAAANNQTEIVSTTYENNSESNYHDTPSFLEKSPETFLRPSSTSRPESFEDIIAENSPESPLSIDIAIMSLSNQDTLGSSLLDFNESEISSLNSSLLFTNDSSNKKPTPSNLHNQKPQTTRPNRQKPRPEYGIQHHNSKRPSRPNSTSTNIKDDQTSENVEAHAERNPFLNMLNPVGLIPGWLIPSINWPSFSKIYQRIMNIRPLKTKQQSPNGSFRSEIENDCEDDNDNTWSIEESLTTLAHSLGKEILPICQSDFQKSTVCNTFCKNNGFLNGSCIDEHNCNCYLSDEPKFGLVFTKYSFRYRTKESKNSSNLSSPEVGKCQKCSCSSDCQKSGAYIGYCGNACYCGTPWQDGNLSL